MANSGNSDANYSTSEASNLSEQQETQEKTEKFGSGNCDAHDDVITLLTDRRDCTDVPSGRIHVRIQERAHESNSNRCSDFNRKIDGNVHSEESNQTGEVQIISQTDSV